MLDDQAVDTGAVSVFFDDDSTLIVLVGDVDRMLSDDLEHAGRDAIDRDRGIVVDAKGVTFMDSVGVAFLVRLAATRREDLVVLKNPDIIVMDLLHITGSLPYFSVVSD